TGTAELMALTSVSGMSLRPDGEGVATRGNVQLVSGEFFDVLRQQPQFGRLLTPADNVTVGAHPVAVVSDAYWRRALGGTPDAVGRELAVNGAGFTIVGITRPGFFGTLVALRGPDVWIPLQMQSVTRYAQNASSSGSANLQNPWPPQNAIQWVMIFARVPSSV